MKRRLPPTICNGVCRNSSPSRSLDALKLVIELQVQRLNFPQQLNGSIARPFQSVALIGFCRLLKLPGLLLAQPFEIIQSAKLGGFVSEGVLRGAIVAIQTHGC